MWITKIPKQLYLYYLKRKREAFGIPEPAPWEDRRELHEWAKG